jgi:hypothetical protein
MLLTIVCFSMAGETGVVCVPNVEIGNKKFALVNSYQGYWPRACD